MEWNPPSEVEPPFPSVHTDFPRLDESRPGAMTRFEQGVINEPQAANSCAAKTPGYRFAETQPFYSDVQVSLGFRRRHRGWRGPGGWRRSRRGDGGGRRRGGRRWPGGRCGCGRNRGPGRRRRRGSGGCGPDGGGGRGHVRWRGSNDKTPRHVRLSIIIVAPAGHLAVFARSTGVILARAYRRETAVHWSRSPLFIASPTHCLAVLAQAAGVPPPSAYRRETARLLRRLTIKISSPAHRLTTLTQTTRVIIASA